MGFYNLDDVLWLWAPRSGFHIRDRIKTTCRSAVPRRSGLARLTFSEWEEVDNIRVIRRWSWARHPAVRAGAKIPKCNNTVALRGCPIRPTCRRPPKPYKRHARIKPGVVLHPSKGSSWSVVFNSRTAVWLLAACSSAPSADSWLYSARRARHCCCSERPVLESSLLLLEPLCGENRSAECARVRGSRRCAFLIRRVHEVRAQTTRLDGSVLSRGAAPAVLNP